jgi:hypothetical protein
VYNFFKALAIAGEKRGVKRSDEASYSYFDNSSRFMYLGGRDSGTNGWWPAPDLQKEKVWEVEPVSVYVWGVCDPDGRSLIFPEKPEKVGSYEKWRMAAGSAIPRNFFPKDKPQKFKLVAVED